MADFNIRSDSVDVEQIMQQIRSRIREKRGVDYTEEQIRELATVKLEKFLDPKNLRSDLLEQFRRSRPAVPSEPTPIEPPYDFSDETIYETHRGPLRFMRKLLNPLLKLLFNPNPLIHVLHKQSEFNVDLLKREQRRRIEFEKSRAEWNALYYEVLHNLVLETTRSGIEIKNLKMRLEALASRLDFSERRVRALEGVVQYRPDIVRPRQAPQQSRWDAGADASAAGSEASDGSSPAASQPGENNRRRRRRRRGRRGTGSQPGGAPPQGDQASDGESDVDGQEQDFAADAGFDDGGAEDDVAPDASADDTKDRDPGSEADRFDAPPANDTDDERQ
jgi:hypothetical protein